MLVFWLGRRVAVLLVAAALLAASAGIVFTGRLLAAPAGRAAVAISGFAFGPATITVKRGTTVTWANADDEPHTVVSDADQPLWKSPPLDTGDSFSFTFDKPGTYRYFCSIHPRMEGEVVVE